MFAYWRQIYARIVFKKKQVITQWKQTKFDKKM